MRALIFLLGLIFLSATAVADSDNAVEAQKAVAPTAWVTSAELDQLRIENDANSLIPDLIEGRVHEGKNQYRAVFKPYPPGMTYNYVYWGMTDAWFDKYDGELTSGGYVLHSHTTFENDAGTTFHQGVWLLMDKLPTFGWNGEVVVEPQMAETIGSVEFSDDAKLLFAIAGITLLLSFVLLYFSKNRQLAAKILALAAGAMYMLVISRLADEAAFGFADHLTWSAALMFPIALLLSILAGNLRYETVLFLLAGVSLGLAGDMFMDGVERNLFPLEFVFWYLLLSPSIIVGTALGWLFERVLRGDTVEPEKPADTSPVSW
jgi:hypothetical protein